MAIRKFKPITNGTRNMSTLVNEEITKATPLKKLTKKTKSNSGRNNQGKITVRHRGGGVKRKYRVIDFPTGMFISGSAFPVLMSTFSPLSILSPTFNPRGAMMYLFSPSA